MCVVAIYHRWSVSFLCSVFCFSSIIMLQQFVCKVDCIWYLSIHFHGKISTRCLLYRLLLCCYQTWCMPLLLGKMHMTDCLFEIVGLLKTSAFSVGPCVIGLIKTTMTYISQFRLQWKLLASAALTVNVMVPDCYSVKIMNCNQLVDSWHLHLYVAYADLLTVCIRLC